MPYQFQGRTLEEVLDRRYQLLGFKKGVKKPRWTQELESELAELNLMWKAVAKRNHRQAKWRFRRLLRNERERRRRLRRNNPQAVGTLPTRTV